MTVYSFVCTDFDSNAFSMTILISISITIMITMMIEKEMMAAPHVDTVFSGTTMVLLIMQGE